MVAHYDVHVADLGGNQHGAWPAVWISDSGVKPSVMESAVILPVDAS